MRGRSRARTRDLGVPLGLVVVAALLARGPVAQAVALDDRQVHVLPVPAGGVSLDITNGRVTIVGSARTDARVEIVRRVPSAAALARLPVEIAKGADVLRIAVLQPDGATAADLVSDVSLELPAAAIVDGVRVGEGALDLRDLHGRLTAVVRRGPITATQVSGTLRLETNIGAITLLRARLVPDGLIRLRTFNGDVRLSLLERPTDARVLALALNGTIRSTIPLTVKDGWGPRWAEATLGKGEPVVSIDVVTGAIVIEAPAASDR